MARGQIAMRKRANILRTSQHASMPTSSDNAAQIDQVRAITPMIKYAVRFVPKSDSHKLCTPSSSLFRVPRGAPHRLQYVAHYYSQSLRN